MSFTRGWFVAVCLVAAACGDNLPKGGIDASPDGPEQTPAERGQYIMNVLANCTFCHTPLLPNGTRDQDNLLAGVDCFADINSPTFMDNNDGFGCVSTRNLTNHETGLKNATDEQIKDAFRNGHRTDGKTLVPIMPYWLFHNMSDEDADAVVAYLRTVPGVNHQVKANEPPFTDINNSPQIIVPYIDPNMIPLPRGADNNASAMRGRYLTSMVGLCIDCHTPTASLLSFELTISKAFAGGRVFPKESLGLVDPANTYPINIATRNLTSDPTGLQGWTRDQISKAIAEGRDRDNNQVCAATHGGAISPYAALEPQDLTDIVEYLYNLPENPNDTAVLDCGALVFPLPAGMPVPVPETGVNCGDNDDDDGDLVNDDGCPETAGQCGDNDDDDGDGVKDDGCYKACGNCAGPPVP